MAEVSIYGEEVDFWACVKVHGHLALSYIVNKDARL